MARVALILSGCGVNDGSEIQEAVLTLLALDEANAKVSCFAPNKPQSRVCDHLAKKQANESRNVLVESARIARGDIRDLAEANANDFDAVILPGGFGAALNLCDFAGKGSDCTVDPTVERFLTAMQKGHKPIGAICIAPAIIAKLFGKNGVKLTVGNEGDGAVPALQRMGAKHHACRPGEIAVDDSLHIVTTPAYMNATRISEAATGIRSLVAAVLGMVKA